jgi:glutathione peroxidase
MRACASFCGYTPPYKGLQALHERYRKRGLVILGFPSNDFGKQEAGQQRRDRRLLRPDLRGQVRDVRAGKTSVAPGASPLFDGRARIAPVRRQGGRAPRGPGHPGKISWLISHARK